MTSLSEVNEQFRKLPLKQSSAIVALIDIKTEEEVEKVLSRLDSISTSLDAKFDAIDAKFDAIDAKFDAFDAKFDAMDDKFESRFNELDSKINNIRWFITTAFALFVVILMVLPLYLNFLAGS